MRRSRSMNRGSERKGSQIASRLKYARRLTRSSYDFSSQLKAWSFSPRPRWTIAKAVPGVSRSFEAAASCCRIRRASSRCPRRAHVAERRQRQRARAQGHRLLCRGEPLPVHPFCRKQTSEHAVSHGVVRIQLDRLPAFPDRVVEPPGLPDAAVVSRVKQSRPLKLLVSGTFAATGWSWSSLRSAPAWPPWAARPACPGAY